LKPKPVLVSENQRQLWHLVFVKAENPDLKTDSIGLKSLPGSSLGSPKQEAGRKLV
jgi:hypothetical protein